MTKFVGENLQMQLFYQTLQHTGPFFLVRLHNEISMSLITVCSDVHTKRILC